ncbi:hypothetical protein CY0110_17667 [Crocosphaera chwakensis CCY0110]|uniref:Uncharacterized protein n=1 Tax=Crocosphaera chwakensis CCY0110 TaxID=391612 RepID=A3IIL5_9CHRO|nr:hypothetical protein CY0110_17667 [Crocosphaera chwakensis CCY0110]
MFGVGGTFDFMLHFLSKPDSIHPTFLRVRHIPFTGNNGYS